MTNKKSVILKVLLSIFSISLLIFTISGCEESSRTTESEILNDDLLSQAEQIIIEGLKDEDPRIRANTVEAAIATQQKSITTKVEKLLNDEYVPVRFSACLAIGDTNYKADKKSLSKLLKDDNESVRMAAAYAMNKLGYDKNVEIIRKGVCSSDHTTRANAVALLGKNGDINDIKLLYWAMADKNSDYKVKLQAAESIAKLGDEKILPKLWAEVYSAYADDRIMGIKAIGALGTQKAKDILTTKLDDDVPAVRLAAAMQLGMLGETTGETEVAAVFEKNFTLDMSQEECQQVNMLAGLAIGQIQTKTLQQFLPKLLQSKSKIARIAAAKAVFQCKTAQ